MLKKYLKNYYILRLSVTDPSEVVLERLLSTEGYDDPGASADLNRRGDAEDPLQNGKGFIQRKGCLSVCLSVPKDLANC